jgi:hypothetical protein
VEAPVKLQGSKGCASISLDGSKPPAGLYLMQSPPESLWWGCEC